MADLGAGADATTTTNFKRNTEPLDLQKKVQELEKKVEDLDRERAGAIARGQQRYTEKLHAQRAEERAVKLVGILEFELKDAGVKNKRRCDLYQIEIEGLKEKLTNATQAYESTEQKRQHYEATLGNIHTEYQEKLKQAAQRVEDVKKQEHAKTDIAAKITEQAKQAEKKAKHAEQQAKHSEQQAKHAEQQAKKSEEQAKMAEQHAKQETKTLQGAFDALHKQSVTKDKEIDFLKRRLQEIAEKNRNINPDKSYPLSSKSSFTNTPNRGTIQMGSVTSPQLDKRYNAFQQNNIPSASSRIHSSPSSLQSMNRAPRVNEALVPPVAGGYSSSDPAQNQSTVNMMGSIQQNMFHGSHDPQIQNNRTARISQQISQQSQSPALTPSFQPQDRHAVIPSSQNDMIKQQFKRNISQANAQNTQQSNPQHVSQILKAQKAMQTPQASNVHPRNPFIGPQVPQASQVSYPQYHTQAYASLDPAQQVELGQMQRNVRGVQPSIELQAPQPSNQRMVDVQNLDASYVPPTPSRYVSPRRHTTSRNSNPNTMLQTATTNGGQTLYTSPQHQKQDIILNESSAHPNFNFQQMPQFPQLGQDMTVYSQQQDQLQYMNPTSGRSLLSGTIDPSMISLDMNTAHTNIALTSHNRVQTPQFQPQPRKQQMNPSFQPANTSRVARAASPSVMPAPSSALQGDYKGPVCVSCHRNWANSWCDGNEPCYNCTQWNVKCERLPCKDFAAGTCTKGSKCTKVHEGEPWQNIADPEKNLKRKGKKDDVRDVPPKRRKLESGIGLAG